MNTHEYVQHFGHLKGLPTTVVLLIAMNYPEFKPLFGADQIKYVGSWSYCRCKFVEASLLTQKKGRSYDVLTRIKRLYEIE